MVGIVMIKKTVMGKVVLYVLTIGAMLLANSANSKGRIGYEIHENIRKRC